MESSVGSEEIKPISPVSDIDRDEPVDVFELIISFMKTAQQNIDMLGFDKKAFVLREIKMYLGDGTYERYAPIIALSIDLVKSMAKNKKLLDGLESLKPGSSCNITPR